MKNRSKSIILFLTSILFSLFLLFLSIANYINSSRYPIGNEMMKSIETQLSLGPRYFGSVGHQKIREYIIGKLQSSDLEIDTQVWSDADGQDYMNIIARTNPNADRRIIIGTHYDSKEIADRDKPNRNLPVPGANDSASGTAVLLEIAKEIGTRLNTELGVDFVFFDAEEYKPGSFNNWNPKGSTFFVSQIPELYPSSRPELAIVVDMVCEKRAQFKKEKLSIESTPGQTDAIWRIGRSIDKNAFVDEPRSEIKDDHTPLAKAGIPSLVIIDLDYLQFHTSRDTLDRCSAKSLDTTYKTLIEYIDSY